MCKLGYPVSRLFTRGSGEEGKNVRGEEKEQGSETKGEGRKHVDKAFMSSFYLL